MIHLKVKQIRYKYRYGCNMKKPQNKKIPKKKKKQPKKPTQPGDVGTMRVNTVPTKLFWWLIFFRAFLYFQTLLLAKSWWDSTKFLFAVL